METSAEDHAVPVQENVGFAAAGVVCIRYASASLVPRATEGVKPPSTEVKDTTVSVLEPATINSPPSVGVRVPGKQE
jgi:hypothetical protein